MVTKKNHIRAIKQEKLSKVVECNGNGLNNFMVGGRGFEERANHGQNVAPKDHEPMQDISNENFKWWRNENKESQSQEVIKIVSRCLIEDRYKMQQRWWNQKKKGV